jgi:hypothetical protein
MPMLFTPELGDTILGLILSKRWMVCYEFRYNGDPSKQQSMDQVYEQVAETLDIVPRYHLFPKGMPFQAFIMGLSSGKIDPPHVTIDGERRIFFGFGLREDHCFFVTHPTMDPPAADRAPKPYEFMLDSLQTLEPFTVTT